MRATTFAVALFTFALLNPSADAQAKLWNLGSHRKGQVHKTTISAANQCGGLRDFSIDIKGEALLFLKNQAGPIVKDVEPFQNRVVGLDVDLRELEPGLYDKGLVSVRCIDCPKQCTQDNVVWAVRLEVLTPEGESVSEDEITSRPLSSGAKATLEALMGGGRKCEAPPSPLNITDWDLVGKLKQNTTEGKSPAVEFEVDDLREREVEKLRRARALNDNLGRIIAAYSPLEPWGISCRERTTEPQEFPKFPREDFFVEVDRCGASGSETLVDFIGDEAGSAVLDRWYRDFSRAMDNFGMKPPVQESSGEGSWGDVFNREANDALEHIAAAGETFRSNLEVGVTTASQDVMSAIVAASVIAEAKNRSGTAAWLAASGVDPAPGDAVAAVGARIAESIEAIAESGIDKSNATAGDTAHLPRSVALSMAVLNDKTWIRAIERLQSESGYTQDTIATLEKHRATLHAAVKQQLDTLCGINRSLRRLIPWVETSWKDALHQIEPAAWQGPFLKSDQSCFCCRYSDASPADKGCRFRVPEL